MFTENQLLKIIMQFCQTTREGKIKEVLSLKEGITDQVNATITKEPWEQDWVIIFYMYSVFIHHIQQQQLHSPNYFLKHYFFS